MCVPDRDPDLPRPKTATQRLGALVGRWKTEGHIVGDAPVPIEGTDAYEWLPGGYFLVHHDDGAWGARRRRHPWVPWMDMNFTLTD